MIIVLALILFTILFFVEKVIFKKKPRVFLYIVVCITFVSYQYLTAWEDDFDDDDLCDEYCSALNPSKNTIDYLYKRAQFYDERGWWALKMAEEATFKISVPEEKTVINCAIGSLIAGLAASDEKGRLVGMCLVLVHEDAKKAIYSSRTGQSYLRYAEFCFDESEFCSSVASLEMEITDCEYEDNQRNSFDLEDEIETEIRQSQRW